MQQRFNPDEIRATKISLGRLGRQRSQDVEGKKYNALVVSGDLSGVLSRRSSKSEVGSSKSDVSGRSFNED